MLKILSFILLFSFILHANALELNSKMEGVSTLSNISFFEDTTKKINMKEIRNIEFESKKKFRFKQGVSGSNWWLKLQVENPTNKSIDWVLKFTHGQIDEIKSWQYDELNLLLSNFSKGDHFINPSKIPFKERTAFVFHTKAQTTNTIYLKLAYQNDGLLDMFHTIWTKDEFLKHEEFLFNLIVGIISVLLAFLFYNIFIWIILRKKEYFWYTVYLVGVILYIASFSQIGSHYLWNKSIYLVDIMPYVSIMILLTSFIFFTRSFLDTPRLVPRVDKILIMLIFINLLILVLGMLGQRYLAVMILQLSSLSFIFFPILGFKLWYDGHKIARGYAIASIPVSAAIIITLLWSIDVLQSTELLPFVTRLGIVVEGILLSIALADRFSILEHAYISEQNKVKHNLQNAKKSLELEVKKRTQKIEEQTEFLNILFKELQHRVKNNFQFILTFLWAQKQSSFQKETKVALDQVKDRINAIIHLHDTLNNYQHNSPNIQKYFDKLLETFRITNPDITIECDISDLDTNYTTSVNLGLIVNELLTNSFKYAFTHTEKPSIHISLTQLDKKIHFIYKDNGSGFDTNLIGKGRGFGYEFIDEFIQKFKNAKSEVTANEGLSFMLSFDRDKEEKND